MNSFLLATKLGARSIAFPLIASGTYGVPKGKVLSIASKAISDFLYVNDSDLKVVLRVFAREAYGLSRKKRPHDDDWLNDIRQRLGV